MAAETEEMRARRRRRRALLDGAADRYRASRRGYPPESVRFIIDTARLGPGSVVPEVGCGTGQLTGQFAADGLAETVIGVETTRATFLSWPEHIQQGFAGDLRRHLQHRADVHLTQQTSLAMAQVLPGK